MATILPLDSPSKVPTETERTLTESEPELLSYHKVFSLSPRGRKLMMFPSWVNLSISVIPIPILIYSVQTSKPATFLMNPVYKEA